MNAQNKIWIKCLDPDVFKDDISFLKYRSDKCYHFLSQFVSLKSIIELNNYLKFQTATRDDPVMKDMTKMIIGDINIMKKLRYKKHVKKIFSGAEIDGIPGTYVYLSLPEGWHRIVTFRKIFSLYKMEYSKFHIGEDEESSPGFKTIKELKGYWNCEFFDKTDITMEWPK